MIERFFRPLLCATLLCTLGAVTAAAGEDDHGPGGQEVHTGAFHVHLVTVDEGFEVHVHDAATHRPVDLSRARTRATLLADGKTAVLPLSVKGIGILGSRQVLPRQWTLLVALEVAGSKPAQARFTSTKMGTHAH